MHGRGFARQDVGLAAINLTSCELRLSQMNDSQTYAKTLAKLNLYRPVEVSIHFSFSLFYFEARFVCPRTVYFPVSLFFAIESARQ